MAIMLSGEHAFDFVARSNASQRSRSCHRPLIFPLIDMAKPESTDYLGRKLLELNVSYFEPPKY